MSRDSMFRTALRLRTIRLVPFAVILLCLISTSSATCYFPNGQVRSDYRQCPGGLSCCLKGESCLSNGLCFGANLGILYRGLCADKSWPIALCPRACYEEIDDGWANLFQCNTSNTLLTCSHEISAPVACQEKNALGTFHYTSANITVAQNGMPTSENTTSNATSCDSANRTAIATPTLTNSDATCPSIVSYNKTQLVAIGAGLGAGLGIPLLLVGGLLLYCSQAKRRQREQLQQQNQQLQQQSQYEHQYQPHINENPSQDMKRLTGSKWKPSELRSSFAGNELAGSTQGRSELPGSFGMI